ncbi:MAG: AI-2E family transporter [Candidatus Azobacteroides sp.]|nr:AI-2E family transporter [Candidatus Azobacteroides sp.]
MQIKKQFNENLKQISFLLVIVFIACLIIGELNYFISSILGALTIYVILRNPHRRLREKGWNNTLATSILLLVTFVVVVLITGTIVSLIYGKLKQFDIESLIESLNHIHGVILREWKYDIFSENIIQRVISFVGNVLPGILSASGNALANVMMMLFVLFFMLQQSRLFERGIESFLPVSDESILLLKKEAYNMILSNAIGIPLIMIGQGITAGLAYWILDAGDPVIWGIITGFFGLIPVIGTGSIWLPLSIDLIIAGHIWQGVILLIYGVCVISNVDYLVRMVFLRKKANIHPVITLFGIIMGMNLFGFWGIIFGPLTISGFFLLVEIYKREFIENNSIEKE